MINILLVLASLLFPSSAEAGCGQGNPNCIVPTVPTCVSDNRAASTAYVTSCGGGGTVTGVSNSDGTLTISPTVGAVVASIALGHANTWSATQTFSNIIDSNLVSGGTQCVQASAAGLLSGTGAACGSGSGAVSSVTNSDGTLTISPTTGAVVASIALGHANTWTGVQTFSGGSGSNGASVVITPPGSSLVLGTNITQTADGSPSASNYSGASGTGYALNNITISSDDMVILASGPTIGIGYGWAINHNFGGANMRGARSAVGISANLTATSSASNQDREYVGSTTYAISTVNDTGTNTGAGAAGSIFAENPFACLCSASATNYFSMNGAEVDISNRGGTVKYKFGWRIVLDAGDTAQGVTIDAAYSVGGGGGHSTGWKQAYGLDDLGANTSPVSSGGCVLCENFAFGPYTITTGINLLGFLITGNAFRSTNFQLNGNGDVSALTYSITGGSAGVDCGPGAPTASFQSQKGIVIHC